MSALVRFRNILKNLCGTNSASEALVAAPLSGFAQLHKNGLHILEHFNFEKI